MLLAKQYLTTSFEGAFWHAGNSLHTCLGYLLLTNQADAKKLLLNAYKIYSGLENQPGWWSDDYGWWGMSFLTAINNRGRLGYADPSYDQLFSNIRASTHDCWRRLLGNWRDTPYRDTSIRGGVFNTMDTNQPLARRNSVTNEDFWLLSLGLAALEPSDPNYGKMAAAEQDWFGQWLDLRNPKGGNGILNADGLVLERPLGTPNDPDFHWSGDQGLFIAAQSASKPSPTAPRATRCCAADPPYCVSGLAGCAEPSRETVSCASSVAAQLASKLKASADFEPGSGV